MSKPSKVFNFEQSLEALNTLVNKMEKGHLPLEESLAYFEKGVAIIRDCQLALKKAENKIQILTQEGNESLRAFTEHKNNE